MELHTLKLAKGAKTKRKRIARGQGSGQGGTSTKGANGAQSRSGYKRKYHFEGGQTSLQRRLPKFGFKNPNRISYVPINVDDLERISVKSNSTKITREVLISAGLVKKNQQYKILARGTLTRTINVVAAFVSEAAKQVIEAQGGSVTISK